MRRIGSRKIAEALLTAVRAHDGYAHEAPCPEGFTLLGCGCDRTAFLHDETSVVYKITKLGNVCYYPQNTVEYRTSRRLAGVHRTTDGHKWIIPLISRYRFGPSETEWVLAMPYAPDITAGDYGRLKDAKRETYKSNWNDVYDTNIGVIDDAFMVRDLGCFEGSRPLAEFERAV